MGVVAQGLMLAVSPADEPKKEAMLMVGVGRLRLIGAEDPNFTQVRNGSAGGNPGLDCGKLTSFYRNLGH